MFRPTQMLGLSAWVLQAAAPQEPVPPSPGGESPPRPDASAGTRTRIVWKNLGGSTAPKLTMTDAPVTAPGKRHEHKLASRRRRGLLLLLALSGSAVVLTLVAGTVAATQRLVRGNQALAEEIQTRAYRLQPESQAKGSGAPLAP